jgi:Kdo2-lipid IVA lauroyltransferase/acyltransferase
MRSARRLMLELLYAVCALVASLLRLAGWRRALVERNVSRCLPDATLTRQREIARAFYSYLGELAAEVLFERFIDRATLDDRVQFENPEVVAGHLSAQRRVLILSAHHANWEWLLLRCSTGLESPLTAVYKKLKGDRLDRYVLGLRERFGCTMVRTRQLVPHLIEQRGEVRLLAMLADQSPSVKNRDQVWTEFFGQPTSFHGGPGWIGSKFGFRAYFAAMRRVGRGRYVVRLVELLPDAHHAEPDKILAAYIRALEAHVRAYPCEYFWAYNRWKRPKPLYG